jgi:cell division protein FtsB
MATSEIFPIFQRTKRPARPARSGPVAAQRPSMSRAAAVRAPSSAATRSNRAPSDSAANGPQLRTRAAVSGQPRSGPSTSLRPRLVNARPDSLVRTRATSASPAAVQARSVAPARVAREVQGDRPARRFLLRAAIALLLAVLGVFALAFLGVLPARTYFGQQDELVQKKARLIMLGERNSALGNRVASLQSDQVVARIARDQFGMVAPGDTLTVLPGLRDESLSLNGDASNIVAALPPANVSGDPALLSSLVQWIRQIVG